MRILHTNDIHGHIENWPVIQAYVEEKIASYITADQSYLLMDIGDAMDTVHPLVEASQGQIMVDLFNQLGYDMVTIGNNEGLNFTSTQLGKLYDQAEFDITLANLLDLKSHDTPLWAQEIVYKTIDNHTLAFIGLTAPYATYFLNGYQILDPFEVVDTLITQIQTTRPDVEGIVLLSHLGINRDRELADEFSDLTLIIGAHTHHVLFEGEWVNQTLLAAAGKYGQYVGEIDLNYDDQKGAWQASAQVKTLQQIKRQLTSPPKSQSYDGEGRYLLRQEVVAHAHHPYYALDLHGSQSYIQMALEAISWYSNTDLAMLNSGLFLADIPQGPVTLNELHESLPHPMHLARVTLTGRDLIDLLEEVEHQRDDLEYKLIHGLGFRGKVFGEVVYRGIEYDLESDFWMAQGKLIQEQKTYQLITVDHLWFLPFFPALSRQGTPELLFPDFIRHVVGQYLKYVNEMK